MTTIYNKFKSIFGWPFGAADWTVELSGKPLISLTNGDSEDIGGYYIGDIYNFRLLSDDIREDEIKLSKFWEQKEIIFRSHLGETAVLRNPGEVFFPGVDKICIRAFKGSSGLHFHKTFWNFVCVVLKCSAFLVMIFPYMLIISPRLIARSSSKTRFLILLVVLSIVVSIILPCWIRR